MLQLVAVVVFYGVFVWASRSEQVKDASAVLPILFSALALSVVMLSGGEPGRAFGLLLVLVPVTLLGMGVASFFKKFDIFGRQAVR